MTADKTLGSALDSALEKASPATLFGDSYSVADALERGILTCNDAGRSLDFRDLVNHQVDLRAAPCSAASRYCVEASTRTDRSGEREPLCV